MKTVIFVGLGGFIGASCRYLSGIWLAARYSPEVFPLNTLVINFLGCFLLGCLSGIGILGPEEWPVKEFLALGVLGGFTTFSAFGLESFEMLKSGQFSMTIIYILISMILCLIAVGLGLLIAKQ
jgi:CrcB protein